METEHKQKEVYFGKFCSKCVYEEMPETHEKCEECLAHPGNIDSHKPVNFIQKV